jgi:hypothetical protein
MWKEIGETINKQLKREGRDTNRVSFFDDIEEMVEFVVRNLQS